MTDFISGLNSDHSKWSYEKIV